MIQFANLSDLEIRKIILQRAKAEEPLGNDAYTGDVARIGSVLSSQDVCEHYSQQLNDALVAYAKRTGVFDTMTKWRAFGRERKELTTPKGVGSTRHSTTLDEGMDSELEFTARRHKHHKVLSGFLTEFEAGQGFNQGAYEFETKNKLGNDVTLATTPGKAVTLPGFVPPMAFRQELLAKARHFKDPGVSTLHGEFTHRIQWYIVCEYAAQSKLLEHAPADIFKACARPVFCEGFNNSSVWDLVFEGGGIAKDFRKPEAVTEYFLRVSRPDHPRHGDLWFLAALMEGRYAKRAIEKARA
ncbi:MAG: hypothetical protein RIQ60_1149 [Pseudomonadota bacterium]|jgi:hypothetical protein